jgi:hypothetical protein
MKNPATPHIGLLLDAGAARFRKTLAERIAAEQAGARAAATT